MQSTAFGNELVQMRRISRGLEQFHGRSVRSTTTDKRHMGFLERIVNDLFIPVGSPSDLAKLFATAVIEATT